MAGQLRIAGGELTLPSNVIIDADISTDAQISPDKIIMYYKATTAFGSNKGAIPASTRNRTVFIASRDAVIKRFACGLINTGAATTDIDFDVQVNGVSILSAPLNIVDTDANYQIFETTTFTPDGALTVDDHVLLEMVPNSNNGGGGPFAWVEIEELGGTA